MENIQHLNLHHVILVVVYMHSEVVIVIHMSIQMVFVNMTVLIFKDVCQTMAMPAINVCHRREHLGVPDIASKSF